MCGSFGFTVFLALISVCASCRNKLGLEPKDLNVVTGGNISITCTINEQSLCSQYSASDLVFKFELMDQSMSSSSEVSSSEDDCDQPGEVLSNETDLKDDLACNMTSEIPSNCSEDLSDYEGSSGSSLKVEQNYVKVLGWGKVQLNYPGLTKRFSDGYLVCCINTTGNDSESVCKRAHILVGEKPYVPIIRNFTVKNWDKFEFHWMTKKKNDLFQTTYNAWYKHSSFEDFQKCPPAKEKCTQSCEVKVDLGRNRDLSGSSMIFKVNASNVVGVATSPEAVVDLYEIVTPDPVHNVNVIATNSSACINFKSPKSGAKLIYEVRFKCFGQRYVKSLPKSNANIREKCFSDLPSYANCSVAIRAKPYSYGRWGIWSDQEWFTMPQNVPLAAPDICRSCFEVLSTKDDNTCNIRVFPKPLPRAVARGRVMTYRCLLTMRNPREPPVPRSIIFNASSSGLDFSDLDLKSNYVVTVVAATEAGYNESIIASPVVVNLTATKTLRKWPRNITAVILNSTTVRMSWLCKRPNLSGFTVFWCRVATLNQCKNQLEWSRVSSNVTHFDVTDLPAFDLLSYLFGVAVETRDGYSSGIVWTKCLYNLSRVSSPPQVDSKVNGTKVRLDFSKDIECNAGFPYAYRIKYCPMHKKITTCPGSATELIVDDDTCEVNHLTLDTKYLFIVSSLSVAGPSLRDIVLELETPSEGGSIQYFWIIVAIVFGIVFVLIAVFRQRIMNWARIPIAPPEVVVRDDHVQPQTLLEDSEHDPDYAHINADPPETSCNVHKNGSALWNGWSSNLDSSSDPLISKILEIVLEPPIRGRRITENNEDDNTSIASDESDNYTRGKLRDKPDVVPSSPPVEPSFPFDSSASRLPNSIVLDFGDVGNELHDLPQPQHLANAVDGTSYGDSSNSSSCGYAVGHMSDRHSRPSLSTADDVSVQMPKSRNNVDVGDRRLPFNSVIVDLVDADENSNDARNVHPQYYQLVPNDSPDDSISGNNDNVLSVDLQPYSSAVVEVRPPEGSRSDDDYSSSILSSPDYAVANLKDKYDPRLDAPPEPVIYVSDGDQSDSNSDEYASVSLLSNKHTADSTDSLPQASNIPHLSF